MPRRLEEILIISSETDYLPFFKRFLGDSGRDIAAVKRALGSVYTPENPNIIPEDNSIGSSWFDCESNAPISIEKLKTFDRKMKIDLMSYQIKNQFIIISYYFEKHCVRHIKDQVTLSQQVDAAMSLFDMEFGTIGEGTLACLHGWCPNSVPYNRSFVVDTPIIVDEIPKFIHNLMTRGEMEYPETTRVFRYFTSSNSSYEDFKSTFQNSNHSVKWFSDRIRQNDPDNFEHPVYVQYATLSVGSNMIDSELYLGATSVMALNVEKDIQELKATDLHRRLSPMLEPDHLTDPDPFDVGGDTIGFFDRTKFTLENLPDFANLPEEVRMGLEDEAFLKILKHFQKPIIWNMSRDVIPEDTISFANESAAETYRKIVEEGKDYRVTTRSAVAEYGLTSEHYDAIYKKDIVGFDGNSSINFVEFRTPSLRPGDVYRAYFEVSKEFLSFIINGKFELEFKQERDYSNQSLNQQISETQSEMQNIYCAENAPNEEESNIKFEKYKAFAMKRKLEISREIRSKTIEATLNTPEGMNLDLGVFGNIPFANVFDDTSITTEEIVESGLSELGSLLSAAIPVAGDNPDTISITMKQIEEGASMLEKIFTSDKVREDLETFKIKNKNQKLIASLEGSFLSQIPGWLRGLAASDRELRKKVEGSNSISSIEHLLDFEPPGLISSGFVSGGTVFVIKFSDPGQIESIQIDNPLLKGKVHDLFRNNDSRYRPLLSPVDRPRTINYFRNIFNMLPLGFAGGAAIINQFVGMLNDPCSGDGEQPSKGAALILKYTIDNFGNGLAFEKDLSSYNPFHEWRRELTEREEIKRLASAYNNIDFLDTVDWGVDVTYSEISRCSLDDLYREVFNKKHLTKLLCNYLKCIKLPDINIQFPNLTLPELPDRPIFELPGLDTGKQLLEIINAMALRLLCAFVSNIFDVLNTPFCEDQLRRDLYGAASDVSPSIQAAFASAMLDTGIPKEKSGNANSLIEDVVNLLTPREICALISGEPAGTQVYTIISNVAENYDLKEELATREKIMNMFATLGSLLPDEICKALNSDNIVGAVNCSETADQLVQIRNIASRGSVDPQRVQQAVDLAEKNILDKSKAFELLTGEKTIADLFPGVNLAEQIISPALQSSSVPVVKATLDLPKNTFLSSLARFVPALYLEKSNIVSIDDAEYDPIATMKFLRAVNNIARMSRFNITGSNFELQGLTVYLRRTLLLLADDFETEEYDNGISEPFLIYKSQREAQTISSATPLSDMEDSSQEEEFSEINTTLKYSIVFSETSLPGAETLLNLNEDDFIETTDILRHNDRYSSVFEKLFPINLEFQKPQDPAETNESRTEVLTSWYQFEFVDANKGADLTNENTGLSEPNPANVSINISYLKAINAAVIRLQQDIQDNIEAVFKSVNTTALLDGIKDFYNIEAEAIRESTSRYLQYIKTSIGPETQKITLKHPVEITNTVMDDTTVNRNYIKNKTSIDDEFFLGSAEFPVETITLCEEVPEKYQNFFSLGNNSNPLRRKVFKEQLKRIAEKYYLDYFLEGSSTPFDNNQNLNYLDDAESDGYLEVLEGVVEQLVSYMGSSRIFEDTAFIQRLDSKLRARTYLDVDSNNSRACIINMFNRTDEGALKFSEVISEGFQENYMNELISPDNNPLTRDYSLPGPFEKAMMTTVFLGFIKTVCLDALLKGAIAYNTWDIDFVSPDPMFKEYMYRLVENNINKQPTFVDNRVLVDDILFKITGTNNRKFAIKQIVDEELSGNTSRFSKILYENPLDKNYFLWFLEKMLLVDAPKNRRLEDNMWTSELDGRDIEKYRQNSFTYLERYIRTNGQLPNTIASPAAMAESQRLALEEFIRFNSNDPPYEQSFKDKMYNQVDPEFLAVPLELDVPTPAEVEGFNIGDASSINTDEEAVFDDDQWPDKELWSLEDFTQLLRSIFSSNSGVEKYIFHLLKKNYDPGSPWHGLPKTLKKRLPVKAIKRSRNYYKFSDKNAFTPKLASDLEYNIEHIAGGGHMERDQSSVDYHRYLIGETNAPSSRNFRSSFTGKTSFDDRYYISSINGEDVFDEQDLNRGIGLESPIYRGSITTNVDPYNQNVEITDEDVLKVVDESWVPPGLTPGENAYINPAGQVTQDEWENFVRATEDIIEEEFWEESIIDLVGNAAPIFNQPGISEWDPEANLSNSQKEEIGRALKDALMYTYGTDQVDNLSNDETGNGEREMSAVLDYNSEISNQAEGMVFDSQGFSARLNGTSFPSRGMGLHDIGFKIGDAHYLETNLGVRDNLRSSGFAYFSNDIEPVYDSNINCYRVDRKGTEVLGEDDYKIPLRMVITQVKDKNGTVKQCFIKYLIPEVVTFSKTDQQTNSRRTGLLTEASVQSLGCYARFINDTWKKTKHHDNARVQAIKRAGIYANTMEHDGRPAGDGVQTYTESGDWAFEIAKSRWIVANYLFGIDFDQSGNAGHGGSVPVLLRQRGVPLPGRSSYGVQICSISKIWSQAAHLEQQASSGHFKVDVASNEFANFDELFLNGVGNLLRMPDMSLGTLPIRAGDVIPQTDLDFSVEVESVGTNMNLSDKDRPVNSVAAQFAQRTSMYNRASRHGFYELSFSQMMANALDTNPNAPPGSDTNTYASIANLVNWFSQRRSDAIFGATSRDGISKFTVFQEGDDPIEGMTVRLRGSDDRVGSPVNNNEAPDYACGPSLFYNDGRTTVEAFTNSIIEQTQEGGSLIGDSLIEAFHIQNKNKFLRDDVVPNDGIVGSSNFGSFVKDEFRHRPFTLMGTVSDVKHSLDSMNKLVSREERYRVYVGGQPATAGGGAVLEVITDANLMLDVNEAIDMDFHRANALRSSYFGSDQEEQEHIELIINNIRNNSRLSNYYDSLEGEASRYPQLVSRLSAEHERALSWVDNLIDLLGNVQAGLSVEDTGLLEALNVRHGLRMNLVAQNANNNTFGGFFDELWSVQSEVGEEERAGRVCYLSPDAPDNYKEHITIPIAYYERPIQSIDECEANISAGIFRIPETIRARDSMMIENLSKDEEFKTFFEFCFPYRRISSLLSVHSTSMLAGYSDMPDVLRSTKSSLAAVFHMMAKPRSFSGDDEIDFGKGFNSTELESMLGTGFPSGGETPDCFEFPGSEEWLDLLREQIKMFMKYFPSVIFRGIADQLDPAYKEMKSHYYACEIKDLRFNSVGWTAGNGETQYGLHGNTPGSKNYVPVNIGFPYDAVKGLGRLLSVDPPSDGGKYLGKSIDRLIGYILGGPKQLIDARYAFQIPCRNKNITGDFRGWSKYRVGKFGRYGHPLTLFTTLALPTYELPRDIEYKNLTCRASEIRKSGVQIFNCSEEDE